MPHTHVHMQLMVHIKATCVQVHQLNRFEQKLNEFWNTERSTNAEFLQTQAYRQFRCGVLQHLERACDGDSAENVSTEITCFLSRGFVVRYSPMVGGIMLLQQVDSQDVSV
jgi:hypothetical protein